MKSAPLNKHSPATIFKTSGAGFVLRGCHARNNSNGFPLASATGRLQCTGVEFRSMRVAIWGAGVGFRSAGVGFRDAGVGFRDEGVDIRFEGVAVRNEGVTAEINGFASKIGGIAKNCPGAALSTLAAIRPAAVSFRAGGFPPKAPDCRQITNQIVGTL